MITIEQKEIAQWALDFALKGGCQEVKVSLVASANNSFEYRNTQLDKLESSSEIRLFIELYVDKKYGSFTIHKLEKDSIEKFLLEGIKSTRYLAEDKCRQLPNAERYYKDKGVNLDLYDASFDTISTDDKIALTKKAVEEIYKSDDRIISVTSAYGDEKSARYILASNGFEAYTQHTGYSLSVETALKTGGDARAESYWYESAIYWEDLIKTGIGKVALERALQKIGQEKVASGKYTLLLDNLVAGRLLSPLISAMYGMSIQQKSSFLIDKLGTQIVSDKLTITDKPHEKRAFGSRMFDGEGVATQERKLIEKGILNTYFIDTYAGLKLEMEPTIASPSALHFELGEYNREQIIEKTEKGIWVTGINGGNSNSTTGDFSFGVEGFLIESGKVTQPISEMNITGNILSLWSNIAEVGNDARTDSAWQLPSFLFEGVNFSGL